MNETLYKILYISPVVLTILMLVMLFIVPMIWCIKMEHDGKKNRGRKE